MDRLIGLLRNSNLSWLLPNLRQDIVIWNSLNNPEFLEKFMQVKPSGSEFTAADFSPSRLALISLDQISSLNKDPQDLLDSIDNLVLQTASRSFSDQTLFQIYPQELSTAGLIALALANRYRTTSSWKNLLDTIQDYPGDHWSTPLICLYGYFEENVRLLNALVQPGASSLQINWAVHVVLSNPLLPEIQISVLMGLCQGEYGDLLPANERLSLVRSLFEQRPQSAIEFCLKWIERYPTQVKHRSDYINHQMDNLNLLAENLFQVEVNKIAGKSHNLSELLETEEEITRKMYADLNNHHVSQVSRIKKGKPFIEELTEIREQITQPNGHKTS